MVQAHYCNLFGIFVMMRTRAGVILLLLTAVFGTATPLRAFTARRLASSIVTVARTTAIGQHAGGQQCDQMQDTEAVTAALTLPAGYGQVIPEMVNKFHALSYPPLALHFASGRKHGRIPPFHRLILFPFHGFW